MQVQQDEEWDDWVQQAFKLLDSNQDGVICEDDMRMTSVDLDEVWAAVHSWLILCLAEKQAGKCSKASPADRGCHLCHSNLVIFCISCFEHPLSALPEGGPYAACSY